MTNKNVELEINLLEELSDADLMAVVGGTSNGNILSDVGALPGTIGNTGTPTTGTITAVTTSLDAVNNDLKNINKGLEAGLQGVNGTVANATS